MTEQSPPPLDLWADDEVAWRPVSEALIPVRRLVAHLSFAPFVLAGGLVAALWWRWAAIPTVLLAVLWVWTVWFIGRQVRAMSWAELPDELAIRQGRLWRRLVTVPYGRIQYVDVQSGPLLRRAGLAQIEVHTANPSSSGGIPGLLEHDAHALRERLSALGESRRAGL